VARLSRALSPASQLGIIFTNGDPTGATDNTVFGADYQYRVADFLGDKTFQTDLFYERSFSDALGEDDAYGIALNFPNEPWAASAAFKEIGEDYDPALGFVNRSGIRDYEANLRYLRRFPNEHALRQFQVTANNFIITDLDNIIETRQHTLAAAATTRNNHVFELDLVNYFERVPGNFLLPGDVLVSTGRYDWTNFIASVQTSRFTQFSVGAEIACCSFYGHFRHA
jgi:hypothetical protein